MAGNNIRTLTKLLSKNSLYAIVVMGCFISLFNIPLTDERILPTEDAYENVVAPKVRNVTQKWPTKKIIGPLEHSHPHNLSQCLTLRLPGVNETLSFEDNVHLLKKFTKPGERRVRVGVSIYEDNNDFWGLNGNGYMHFYHYLEFLLYAYTALDRVANVVTPPKEKGHETSLSEAPIDVPWVHAPYLTRKELKGQKDTNHMIADLAFWQSSILGTTQMKGIEDNDDRTREIHPQFQGKMPIKQPDLIREKMRQSHIPLDPSKRRNNWRTMTDNVDAVIFINRHKCDHKKIGQMHAALADPGYFPAEAWSKDIATGLGTDTEKHTYNTSLENFPDAKDKFVACYIDRQNNERRMPDEEHEWLVQTLKLHPDVYFRQLRMEKYPALEQFQIAHTCNMMIGVHGNGLSHQLWMNKGGYVVEYFWETDFVWCYSILALMMNHDFRIFWRGKPIDEQRIRNRDPTLVGDLKRDAPLEPQTARINFVKFLNDAVAKFKASPPTAAERR